MTTAKFITEIKVTDPDTGNIIEVEIFKEIQSGGIFGVDSSYLLANEEEDETVTLPSLFNDGKVKLLKYEA